MYKEQEKALFWKIIMYMSFICGLALLILEIENDDLHIEKTAILLSAIVVFSAYKRNEQNKNN